MWFCGRARVVKEPSAPLYLYRFDSQAARPDQVTREPRFCCSASFVARGEAGNCSTVAC
jgi:hypothetical protein